MDKFEQSKLYKSGIIFVREYWDVGTAILAGFAINDYNNYVLGNVRWPVFLLSCLATLKGSQDDATRFLRNAYAGLASLSGFWTLGLPQNTLTEKVIGSYSIPALAGCCSIYIDSMRKNKRKDVSN